MMRRPVIAGNWKMNMTPDQARTWVNQFKGLVADASGVEIVVCPPFTTLLRVCADLAGTGIRVGAQNMHWETGGAFTGEISPTMLTDLGCSHVLLGHSERRALFAEADQQVNKKLLAALEHRLTPVLCIGETLAQREQGVTEEVCRTQLLAGLAGISEENLARVVIAYEPVWAIGTGRTATPGDAQAVISFIRDQLATAWQRSVADRVPILYGGSVKPDNIDGLMAMPDIDGVLVGGASLDPQDFARIVNYEAS